MFLPNLQKNIQELERQISRLETECEHSVSSLGRREISPGPQDFGYQPFITGPSLSAITYSAKMLNPPPQDLSRPASSRQAIKPPEKRTKTSGEDPRGREARSPDAVGDQKKAEPKVRGPAQGAREVGESSKEEQYSRKIMAKITGKLKEVPREPTWCELLGEQTTKPQPKGKKEGNKSGRRTESSDEESCVGGHVAVCERPRECEGAGGPRSGRRSRSARTRRNHPQQPPEEETGPSKSLQEKETQCHLSGDKGKGEFFLNINEYVRVLQGLVEELKKRPNHEKRSEVLNDMQDTLKKMIEVEESSSRQDAQALKDTFSKLPEGADNIVSMKNALFAVKKICEELSNEKAALAEEICVKNVALANCKAKEKEYMAIIANLKYTLEKQKELADEGMQVKRDVRILSVRLQEEAKVIEALKKSHEKMQELVENYVLENDRLKAHVKITKLESQKYSVLLAGKDAEIMKYKKEIESFQKQITEQLSLLRSRATESEVQQTIEAISNQASILQKDDDSGPQDDDDSLDSSSTKTQATLQVSSPPALPPAPPKREWEEQSKESSWGSEGQKRPETAFGPRKSPREAVRQLELENVLNSSNNLRNSINDLLEDIKREASDVYWMSAPNSCRTSVHSTPNMTTSEDGSDLSPKD